MAMCLYYDEEYREEDTDFEPCFPVSKRVDSNEVNSLELPKAKCLCLTHIGPYEEPGRSYGKLLNHARIAGVEFTLPTREIYVKGPGMIFKCNPKKYVNEIQLPIG